MEGLCPCGHEPTGSIVPVSELVREHQNKYISIRRTRSLKSTCNDSEHLVSGADVSCCVGVAD